MFELKGVFAEKLTADGQLLRMKNLFTQNLNTEIGVIRFIQEQRPFAELEITTAFGENRTEYFLDKVKKDDERHKG